MQQMFGVLIMTVLLDDKSTIRSSTGVALNLMTPIGPLSFSFANALQKHLQIKLKLLDLI